MAVPQTLESPASNFQNFNRTKKVDPYNQGFLNAGRNQILILNWVKTVVLGKIGAAIKGIDSIMWYVDGIDAIWNSYY